MCMPTRVFEHAIGNHYIDSMSGAYDIARRGDLIAVAGGQTGLLLFDESGDHCERFVDTFGALKTA